MQIFKAEPGSFYTHHCCAHCKEVPNLEVIWSLGPDSKYYCKRRTGVENPDDRGKREKPSGDVCAHRV
jgi:hypothetical protein